MTQGKTYRLHVFEHAPDKKGSAVLRHARTRAPSRRARQLAAILYLEKIQIGCFDWATDATGAEKVLRARGPYR